MDFWESVRVLRRRWLVAVPAALLAFVIAGATYMSIPTRYESTGVLVLTSPSLGGTFTASTKPEDVQRINPLLAFDSSLITSAQILIQIVRDPAVAEQLGVGPDSTDTFELNNGSAEQRGPFVVVTATSESSPEARALTGRVLDRIVQELDERQRAVGAPASTFITSQALVRPTQPQAKIGGKVRFAGAALLLTLFLAIASPFAVESIANGRQRQRLGLGPGRPGDTRAAQPPHLGSSTDLRNVRPVGADAVDLPMAQVPVSPIDDPTPQPLSDIPSQPPRRPSGSRPRPSLRPQPAGKAVSSNGSGQAAAEHDKSGNDGHG